jgi:hypothetical protein
LRTLIDTIKCALLFVGLLVIFRSATRSAVAGEGGSGTGANVDRSGQVLSDGFKVERYARLWERNPFTLPSQAAPETIRSAFENLYLTSWLDQGGRQVIYVQNSQTNEVQRITPRPNQNNLRLIGIHLNSNPRLVDAVIASGREQGTVKFRFDIQVATALANPAAAENQTNSSGDEVPQTSETAPRIYPGMPRVRSEGGHPSQIKHSKFPSPVNASIAGQG